MLLYIRNFKTAFNKAEIPQMCFADSVLLHGSVLVQAQVARSGDHRSESERLQPAGLPEVQDGPDRQHRHHALRDGQHLPPEGDGAEHGHQGRRGVQVQPAASSWTWGTHSLEIRQLIQSLLITNRCDICTVVLVKTII